MADYRPLVLSGTAANSVITELPTSSILIAEGVRLGASALSISGHLELTGGLSGTPSVSSTAINSPAFTGGTFTGTSVSSTESSAVNYNGMPYPQPFAYVECSAAGTNTNDEINFASGATTTTVISDTTHIAWNDGEKYFTVSAAGTYELLGNFVVDSGSQSDPLELRAKKNGSTFHTISPKLYGTVGPEERTFHSIFTASSGDYITVSIQMDDGGSKTAHLEAGSNLTLKRIK